MQQLALNELQKSVIWKTDFQAAFERRYLPFSISRIALRRSYPFTRFVWSPFTDPVAHFFTIVLCFCSFDHLPRAAAMREEHSHQPQSGSHAVLFAVDAPGKTTEYLYVDQSSAATSAVLSSSRFRLSMTRF